MKGLAERLGTVSENDRSAAIRKSMAAQKAVRESHDRQAQIAAFQRHEGEASIKLSALCELINLAYVKPLWEMGLLTGGGRRPIVPIHPEPGAAPSSSAPMPPIDKSRFSREGRYQLSMFLRSGTGQNSDPAGLGPGNSFSILLGFDASGDEPKISVWVWDGAQKYLRDDATGRMSLVPAGAVTVRLKDEHDLDTLQTPLTNALTVWLEAVAERDPGIKSRLSDQPAPDAPLTGTEGRDSAPLQHQTGTR